MRYDTFVTSVQKYAGSSDETAQRAADKTLEVLGEVLARRDRTHLAGELPDQLGTALQRSTPGQDFELEEFYDRVVVQEDEAKGFQLEHAQAVCQALADWLEPETRKRLQTRLPESYEHLFTPRDIPSAKRGGQGNRPSRRKLSSSRPGSSQPLSEAQSGDAHRNSVVESDHPRGNRKLSSSEGANEGRDLAGGRPDSERP